MDKKFASRKFIVVMSVIGLTAVMLIMGKLEGDQFAYLMGTIISVYVGAQAAVDWKMGKGGDV